MHCATPGVNASGSKPINWTRIARAAFNRLYAGKRLKECGMRQGDTS
jgi:hypothetical protein